MSNSQKILLAFLLIVLLFRLFFSWPLSTKPNDLQPPEQFTSFRINLSNSISQIVPQPAAGLLSGVILGQKSTLPKDFSNALNATSTVHIVVASGQNLTILSGFILSLAPLIGRKKTVIISATFCTLYTLLAGLQIPIIRAAIMVLIAGSAQLFNREIKSFYLLCLTALLMLIFEPNWLLSVSFQLSFLATVGVVVVAPELMKFAKRVPELLREDLVVSFCAQALTVPVIAAVFHQFSIIGLVANAFVLWTVAPMMTIGMVGLSLIWIPVVNKLVFLIPAILATYFIYIINFFNQPWAMIKLGEIPSFVILGYYLILSGAYLWIKAKNTLSVETQLSN